MEKPEKEIKPIILTVLVVVLMLVMQSCSDSNKDNLAVSNTTPVASPVPSPTPPENYFPATLGGFAMTVKPSYSDPESKECQCRYFIAAYRKENMTASYRVGVFDSAEKAKQIFDAKVPLAYVSEVLKQTGNEITAIRKDNGNAEILRLSDKYIIKIEGKKDAVVALENSLPYKSFGIAQPSVRKVEEFVENPVLVSLVLSDLEKDPANATKKYVGNFVLLKAKVVEAGDDVEKKTIVEKTPTPTPRPRRTPKPGTLRRRRELMDSILGKTPSPTPTPKTRQVESHHPYVVIEIPSNNGGEPLRIMCNFNSLQKDNVTKLKSGEEILFRAKISFSNNVLKIDDARLEENL